MDSRPFPLRALAALAALALVAPAAAEAASVHVEDTGRLYYSRGPTTPIYRLVVDGAPGERNDVAIAYIQGQTYSGLTVVERGAPLAVGDGCVATAPGAARCGAPGLLIETLVRAGDGDDRVEHGQSAVTHAELLGGEGDDELTGFGGGAVLDGGPGADSMERGRVSYASRTEPVAATIDGMANDGAPGEADAIGEHVHELTGGAAGDLLGAGAAGTTLHGGPGPDRLEGSPARELLYGDEGNDTIDAGAGNDGAFGGDGDDLVAGGAGDDYLPADAGADTLRGGPGRDTTVYRRTGLLVVTLDDRADDGEAGEGDDVGSDVEDVDTAYGNASVIATDAANRIQVGLRSHVRAGAGDDVVHLGGDVDLGPGRDLLVRGGGIIRARDGEPDQIGCREIASALELDPVDVLRHCLRVLRVAGAPLRATRKRRVAVRVWCLHPSGERCRGTLRVSGERRVRLPGTRRWHPVGGKASFSLPRGRGTVTLGLSRADMLALRREGAMRAAVVVRPDDPAGARTEDERLLRAPRGR